MSRTPFGSGSPSRGPPKTPPSRLVVPPSIRPSSSLSNLHIHSHAVELSNPPPVPPLPIPVQSQVLDSTASSVIDLDMNEGILLQDVDVETEAEDITAMSLDSDTDKGDEDSKKTLRDNLRRTLSHTTSRSDTAVPRPHLKGKSRGIYDIPFEAVSRYQPRQYFVLTDAGKPVFISQPDGEDVGNVAATIGVMQALISVFLDDNDKLRYINAGRTRISFLLRPPLYYACASSWGEPESVKDTLPSGVSSSSNPEHCYGCPTAADI